MKILSFEQYSLNERLKNGEESKLATLAMDLVLKHKPKSGFEKHREKLSKSVDSFVEEVASPEEMASYKKSYEDFIEDFIKQGNLQELLKKKLENELSTLWWDTFFGDGFPYGTEHDHLSSLFKNLF